MFETNFGYVLVKTPAINSGHHDGLKVKLEALDKVFIDAQKAAEAIAKSNDFTKAGKRKALARVGKDLVTSIESVRAKENFDTLLKHANDIERAVRKAAKPKPESVKDYLRAREIRDHYLSLDPIGRQTLLDEAIREDMIEIIEALKDAPIPMPGLHLAENQKRLQAYDADELSRLDPEQAAERNSLLEAHRELKRAEKTLVKTVNKEFGTDILVHDEIAELASAETSEAA